MSPWLHHTFFLILPHWRKSCCWLVVFSKNYSMPLFLPRNFAFTINPFDRSRRNLWLKLHKLKPVTKRKLPPLKDTSYHLPWGRSIGVTRMAAICSVIPSHTPWYGNLIPPKKTYLKDSQRFSKWTTMSLWPRRSLIPRSIRKPSHLECGTTSVLVPVYSQLVPQLHIRNTRTAAGVKRWDDILYVKKKTHN